MRIVYFKGGPIQGKGPANRLPDRGSHRPVIMLQLAKIAIGNANPRSHDGLGETQSQAQAAKPFTCIEPLLSHATRSEEHTSELQSLMRISYAVFCLKKKTTHTPIRPPII